MFEINGLIQPAIPPEVVKESSRFLSNGYIIVKQITKIIGDKMPNHRIAANNLEQMLFVFNAFNLENEASDLLSYASD
mgnify:CR=1 FL=1